MNLSKTFFKITISISLMGIFILLLISNIQQPSLITINQITLQNLDKNIKIQGQIINIKSYEDSNFQVISIKDSTGKIEITTNQILNLNNLTNLTVIGKVTEYKNNLQVQADKIFIS